MPGALDRLERRAYVWVMRNPVRMRRVGRIQRSLLPQMYDARTRDLAVVLAPGIDRVSGGVLSLSSVFAESRRMLHPPDSDAMMCTVPRDPPLVRYSKTSIDVTMFQLPQALGFFPALRRLFIHIPEFYTSLARRDFTNPRFRAHTQRLRLHFNILLQNIELIPSPADIRALQQVGTVTCTTSHDAYLQNEKVNALGCPIRRLSTYVSPEQYERVPLRLREDILVVSPDPHPMKELILKDIRAAFPNLRLVVVRNMSYKDYKALVAQAKWSLTFGEGLDGYFIETIFSGGVGFAVYNPGFFTPDFQGLRTVYRDYGQLRIQILKDLRGLDVPTEYSEYQDLQFRTCASHYNFDAYVERLRNLYREYSFPGTDAPVQ